MLSRQQKFASNFNQCYAFAMNYALVTGADHGVGLALVTNLLARGWTVLACRLNPSEKQVDALKAEYADTLAIIELDVSKDESVSNMASMAASLVPHLDLVINNAGILGDMEKEFGEDINFNQILTIFNVNAVGPLRVSNALSALVMKSTLKTIVDISSEAGSIHDCYRVGWWGYGMSKAANNMQGALVYNNIRDKGGRVIQMHPGWVKSLIKGFYEDEADITPDESAKGILHTVLDTELPVEERPLFLTYQGERLPW